MTVEIKRFLPIEKSVKCIIIIKIKGNKEVKNSGSEKPHRERKTF